MVDAVAIDGEHALDEFKGTDGIVEVLVLGDDNGHAVEVVVTVDDLGTIGLDGLVEIGSAHLGIIEDDERARRILLLVPDGGNGLHER